MDLSVSKIYEVLSKEEEQKLNETIIYILICFILCDREKHRSEIDALKEITKSLSWHSTEALDDYIGKAMRDVSNRMNASDYQEYFSNLYQEVTNKEVQQQLIEAAEEIILVDGEVSASEKAKLADMTAFFDKDKKQKDYTNSVLTNNVCIYHGSCPDGFGAALAVKLYFDELNQDCDFHAAYHGDTTPDVAGKNVIMVDFAYKRESMIEIKNSAKNLTVLDHHESAKKSLSDIEGCIFDMTRSGAVMAWEHFHPTKKIPMLFLYIQDKDLYQWKLPESREFSAGLRLLDFDFDLWESLTDDTALLPLIEKGRVIEEYNAALIESAIKPEKYRLIELYGHTVPIINATNLISDIGNKLAAEHPFAVCYFDTPTERKYSLRSLKEKNINVALIAESLGGGGHPEAAGFGIPLDKQQL